MACQLHINEWVALSEDGIWFSPFDEEKASWKTKKELVQDIGAARLDSAKTPKIKRETAGQYVYLIKNCDTGQYDSEYTLVKLTPENIQHYQEFLDDENDT